jgi:hypothetical protein
MSRRTIFSLRAPLLILACLCLAASPATQPSSDAITQIPDPEYTPRDVVQIQLDALQHNDDPSPDAGIAIVFRFASPQNQQQTGPLPKFTQMIKGPVYAVMLNYQSADFAPVQVVKNQARQLIRLTASDGTVAYFAFLLQKQSDGPFKNCWMTDGVVRLAPPAPPPDDAEPLPPPRNTGGDRQAV